MAAVVFPYLSPVWVLAALALLAAAPAAAQSRFDEDAQALAGYWFAPARGAEPARTLRITQVIFADAEGAVLAGHYGNSAAVLPPAREIVARWKDRRLDLEVTAWDGKRLALAAAADGTLRAASAGGRPELRFARSTFEAIQRHAADHPPSGARAGARSEIELVYFGAIDCSMCRAWEERYLAKGELKGAPEWPQLRFTELKRTTLAEPPRLEDAPPRLRPRLEELAAQGVPLQYVPTFVLYVNGALRAHAVGNAAFESFAHAALRAAVREKLAASAAAGSSPQPRAR